MKNEELGCAVWMMECRRMRSFSAGSLCSPAVKHGPTSLRPMLMGLDYVFLLNAITAILAQSRCCKHCAAPRLSEEA